MAAVALAPAAEGKQPKHRKHISPARERVVQALNRGLAGSPMAGTGRALEASGWKWGISPFFIAAIAESESSLGARACSGNRYNAFGLASCGTWNGVPPPTFRSWAHAYDFEARFLTGHTWVTSGWPHAQTTYDFHGYAACSSCWGAAAERHMRNRFGVSNRVRYP